MLWMMIDIWATATFCRYVAIPTRYGSIVARPEDGKVFERYVKGPTKVEFRIKF
jgi:hypothetical protein